MYFMSSQKSKGLTYLYMCIIKIRHACSAVSTNESFLLEAYDQS